MDIKECVSTEVFIKYAVSTEDNMFLLAKSIEWLKEDVLLSYLSLKKNDFSVVEENSVANRHSNIIRSDEDSSKEKCSGYKRLQISVGKDVADLENLQFAENVSFKVSNSSEKCYEQLLSVGRFEQHNSSQIMETNLVCDICRNSFETAILLCRHKKTHNKEKTFICEICGKQFARKQHLDNHKFHHTISCFRKQVDQNKDMSTGNMQHFEKTEEISKKLLSKQHSSDHVPKHGDTKLYSCDECHKNFAKVEYLNNHKLFYHIRSCFHKQLGDQRKETPDCENSTNCRCCHKMFPLKDLSEQHFLCAECHTKYGKAGRSSSHKSLLHIESCFYRQDELCEKNINNDESQGNSGLSKDCSSTRSIPLNTIFSGEKEFKCDECHRKFAKEEHLSSHKLFFHVQSCFHKRVGLYEEQQGITNFCYTSLRCMRCQQDFSSKQELMHHHVICNIKKQYVCDKCNVGFEKQSYLDNHKLFSHAQTCFKNQGGSVHQLARTDHGTLYSCNSCQKKFVLKEHFQSHKLKCGNKEFACDICNARFVVKVHLTSHKLFRHKSSCFSK